MIHFLLVLFYIITAAILIMGILALTYYPLAVIFELRSHHPPVFETPSPLVSIIVPAYNEEKVIANCVKSILTSNYKNFEVILVDDGSTDRTLQIMRRYENPPRVQVVTQPNGGKAAALNNGFQHAKGEILFFVDADGIFIPTTIEEMLKGFDSEKVGAVCGNDAPTNLNRLQTQLIVLQSHVGTGFVRRALAVINCLPIVSGNVGAFRRSVLDWPFTRLGQGAEPYKKGFIGEDLELTWRIHRAGYRVNFAPRAIVLAEVPSTLKALWKQRVRWARGLLQTVSLHRDMFFNLKYGMLGLYLPINFFNLVVIPVLQLLILFLVVVCALAGYSPVELKLLNLILWFGLTGAVYSVIFAVALDEAWRDLKYFYVLPLWIPFTIMMDIVTIWAIILELRGAESRWNKFDRTGVVSRRSF